MRLHEQYKAILDEGFKKHFLSWDQMSPLDPVKTIAEGLTAALADLEVKHNRYVDQVLDSLPSLFNFPPRTAQPEKGLFEFLPQASLTEPRNLPSDTLFKLQGDKESFHIAPLKPITIYPLSELVTKNDGKQIELSLSSKCALGTLGLTFAPSEENEGIRLQDFSLTVRHIGSGETKTVFRENLELIDDSANFARPGTLTLSLKHSRNFLCEGPAQFQLTLRFSGNVPNGEFLINTVPCAIFKQETDVILGALKGEPWEHIALADDVLSPPSELHILYPDDTKLVLHRVEADLLKLRHAEPGRFNCAFFYNASTHTLVLPSASSLFKNFTGGIQVMAPQLEKCATLPEDTSNLQAQIGDWGSTLDKVNPKTLTAQSIPRESTEAYLRRFYTALRLFSNAQTRSTSLIPSEISPRVAALDSNIRCVELGIDTEKKELTVFLLLHGNESSSHPQIPAEISQKVADFLNRVLPLDFQWKIKSFEPTELSIDLSADLCLREERHGLIMSSALADRMGDHLRRLLSPESVSLSRPVGIPSVLESLKTRLSQPMTDHTELNENELEGLKALVLNTKNGQYTQTLSRNPGELYLLRIDTKINLTHSQDHGLAEESRVKGGRRG